jgi:NAD(P)-dependent dehydrogenase (short-subunit alcohol dehydrogenase family)
MLIVITGCTAGLGLACVEALRKKNTSISNLKIVFANRNVATSERIIKEKFADIAKQCVVLPEPLNLTSLASVRNYAQALIKYLEINNLKIDVLVNNAGIGGQPTLELVTQDKSKSPLDANNSFESIFITNHLGHFLLTLLLTPYITERIINVSSEVHDVSTKTGLPDPSQNWPVTDAEFEKHLAKGEPILNENANTSGYTRIGISILEFEIEICR